MVQILSNIIIKYIQLKTKKKMLTLLNVNLILTILHNGGKYVIFYWIKL